MLSHVNRFSLKMNTCRFTAVSQTGGICVYSWWLYSPERSALRYTREFSSYFVVIICNTISGIWPRCTHESAPYKHQTSKQISSVINIFISSKHWHTRALKCFSTETSSDVNDSQTDQFSISLTSGSNLRVTSAGEIRREPHEHWIPFISTSALNHRTQQKQMSTDLRSDSSEYLIESEVIRIKGGFSLKPGNTLFKHIQTFSRRRTSFTICPRDLSDTFTGPKVSDLERLQFVISIILTLLLYTKPSTLSTEETEIFHTGGQKTSTRSNV